MSVKFVTVPLGTPSQVDQNAAQFQRNVEEALTSLGGAVQSVASTPGPQGPSGPSGSIGPRGPQGDRGPSGSIGPSGSVGPSGSSGIASLVGQGGTFVSGSTSGSIASYSVSSSIGADPSASYVVVNPSAQLPNARVLTPGSNVYISDAGPGGSLTIGTVGVPLGSSPYLLWERDPSGLLTNAQVLAAGNGISIAPGSGPIASLTASATVWIDGGGAAFTTSSVAIGTPNTASFFGSDVAFYVSGTHLAGKSGHVSLFGGDLVISGSTFCWGGVSGSLQRLTSGDAYLVGTGSVGITTNSLGQVVISASLGSTISKIVGAGGTSVSSPTGPVVTVSSSFGTVTQLIGQGGISVSEATGPVVTLSASLGSITQLIGAGGTSVSQATGPSPTVSSSLGAPPEAFYILSGANAQLPHGFVLTGSGGTVLQTSGNFLIVSSSVPTAPPVAAPYLARGYFGNGDNGDVTISSNTTLVTDKYYANLTVGSCTLNANGYRIFVSNTLTLSGTISNDGASTTSHTGGAGAAIGSIGGATVANGTSGGAGAGGSGTSMAINGLGGNGGTGGAGTAGGGGPGGGTSTGGSTNRPLEASQLVNGYTISPINVFNAGAFAMLAIQGGAGGGAGGGNDVSNAGGGGGGGGAVCVSCRVLIGSGTIQAAGGNGGPGNSTLGGGGGGGGGWIGLCYEDKSGFTGTLTCPGGTGGAAPGGNAGGNGSNGFVVQLPG